MSEHLVRGETRQGDWRLNEDRNCWPWFWYQIWGWGAGRWVWHRGSESHIEPEAPKGTVNTPARGPHLPDFTLLRSQGRKGGDEPAASAQRTRRFWQGPPTQEAGTTEADALKSPVTYFNWPRVSEHFLLFFPSVSSLKLFQQTALIT